MDRDRGKWVISIDRPTKEGVIDVTEIMTKIQTPSQRDSLFRWVARSNCADSALLIWQNPAGHLCVQAEYLNLPDQSTTET